MSSSARPLQTFALRHLPDGRTLPDAEWQRRHRGILALLWVLAGTLPLYGVLRGHAIGHDLAYGLGLLGVAALASRVGARRTLSSAIASYGLCMASAIAVHLANGAIEAHFMFFVVIIVISLYEDWRPFLIAFGFVVAHHGVMGVVARGSVYSHGGDPWVLALIHGAFVAAAGIASIVSWRLNETLREEARRAGDRAVESDARFRSAFEDGPLGMALVEISGSGIGTVRQVNRKLCQQYGYTAAALRAAGVHALVEPASITILLRHVAALHAGEVAVAHDELRLRHHDGHLFDGRVSMSLVAGTSPGDPSRDLVVQVEDVTERNLLKRELQDLADHDPLTGLVNRRRFNVELAQRLAAGRRHRLGGAVILIDLDGFKEINDTLGHESGDELLVAVATVLRETCRADDVIARLGGDEFALLIGNAAAAAARGVAERIVAALHDRAVIGYGANERRASASIGVVVYSRGTEMTGDQLLNDADLAMYQAKDDGGNRCAVYSADPADGDGSDHAPSWPERIRRALADEHMTMYAQPIVDLRSGAITNFELLLRMIGPSGEIIAPGAFLPVAERRGMIRTIDRWVIGEAVKLLDELGCETAAGHDRAHDEIRLHVNLSGRSLSDVDFMDFIRARIDGAGVDPRQLVFEITETAAIANVDDACRFLTELSELGCGIALDDFGAGFGSLHYLKNLPVDLLKIDGQFISNLTTNPDDLVVVESLVRMAGGLRMRTAAEYVEDAATLQLLGDLGVDFAQGYHVGRPGPARQVIAAPRSARAS